LLFKEQTHKLRQMSGSFLTTIRQEAIWIPIGRVLAMLAGVVAVRALTELVSPEQYGRLSLVTGSVSFFSLVLYTSMGKSANRYVWDYSNQKQSQSWFSAIVWVFILTGLVFTLFLWGAIVLGFDLKIMPHVGIWTIPFFLVAGSLASTLLGMLNTLQEHRVFVVGTVIYAWLKPGLAILVVLLVMPTAESIMIGYALASIAVLLGVLYVAKKFHLLQLFQRPGNFSVMLRPMFLYAAPFLFVHIFYWIQTTANRFVLDFSLGLEQVGIFVVAAAIGRIPIQAIESIFGQIHAPELFQKIGRQDNKDVDALILRQAFSDYLLAFLVIVLPIFWFTIFGSNILMRLLAGQAYWIGVAVMPWITLAEFLRAFTAAVGMAFEVERRPRSLILPIAVASIVTLVLTYVFGNLLGIVGAGLALATGTFVWFILTWLPASQLACWRFSWSNFLKTIVVTASIVGTAWLFMQMVQLVFNLGFLAHSILFIVVFSIGYLLYAGRRLLH
jgi:O-antigen/teichoic acid export membrane protein